MTSWISVIAYFGGARVMIPVAIGIAAWIALLGKGRLALQWLFAFGTACFLVAASKAIYRGWGWDLPAIGYKALSGHAMLAAAIMPMLCCLAVGHRFPGWHSMARLAGCSLSVAMSVFLVYFDYHTVSEVVGGWLLGSIVSLSLVTRLPVHPLPESSRRQYWLPVLGSVLALSLLLLGPVLKMPWIEKAASHFSGRSILYDWEK